MIVHPAITIGNDGEPIIDLDLLKESANSGKQDLDSALARMILIAFDAGFQMGIAEASQANMRAQMLLHCTGGNA